jgi:hypothetical protein
MVIHASNMMARTDFLVRQRAILEQVFGEDWFRKAGKNDRQHPAYIRWQLCQTLIEQGNIKDIDELLQLGKIALDTYYFLQLTGGDMGKLELGVFDSIGDEQVRKHIRSGVKDPVAYEDLMVELYVASWHKANNHAVSLVEIDEISWPDLRVDMDVPNIPMLIECKHLRSTEHETLASLQRRVRQIIHKANEQIKAGKKAIPHEKSVGHEHCYGLLVLDVSAVIPAGGVVTAGFPNRLLEVMTYVQRALSGDKNTSVHTAILVWDTYDINLDPARRLRYVCSRSTLRVPHTQPFSIFPEGTSPGVLAVFNAGIQSYMLNDYEFQLVVG